jgi:hypothetical protein
LLPNLERDRIREPVDQGSPDRCLRAGHPRSDGIRGWRRRNLPRELVHLVKELITKAFAAFVVPNRRRTKFGYGLRMKAESRGAVPDPA